MGYFFDPFERQKMSFKRHFKKSPLCERVYGISLTVPICPKKPVLIKSFVERLNSHSKWLITGGMKTPEEK